MGLEDRIARLEEIYGPPPADPINSARVRITLIHAASLRSIPLTPLNM